MFVVCEDIGGKNVVALSFILNEILVIIRLWERMKYSLFVALLSKKYLYGA